ncbi:Ger(x)C family spore germination protein [Tepidibacter formicigenes]|jgi:spore germination protein KC|uniref:Germination protein, Ger(X)C family n=1 Tax=Tepidibacter formicigenes DSM 15518 TaxID=1123349 RepID=A0A1M6MB75_9FIRM|nr:Ger(x)C family spore germination protein [Tepidibacter formicigenes]SHJ80674.1 germination protein, Ger(x)C family [Tepidibacter formicigenes DSM 15518]
MIKKFNKLILLSMVILILTSCWDYKDIDQKCIVQSVGIDRVDGKIEFSGEITQIRSSKGGGGATTEKAQVSSVYKLLSYGKNFEEARINYDSVNPFPVFLGAIRIVAFGRDFAKEGIEPYLNRIDKFYDYRKTALAVVSREKPRKLFAFPVDKDISMGFLIEDILRSLEEKGMGLHESIGEILSYVALEEVGYLLPYVGIEEESVQYLGLAVMKDSKLIGVIPQESSEGILYLLSNKPRLTEVITLPNEKENKYTVITSLKKRKIKTEYKNSRVIINIDLDLGAQLQYQYYTSSISNKKIKIIENKLSQKIKRDIINNTKTSQKEFKCDYFQFAKYFKADNPKIYKNINWKEEYINSDINVDVKVEIKNLGFIDPNAKPKY